MTKYIVVGSPGSYTIKAVRPGGTGYDSGMTRQAAQETADSLKKNGGFVPGIRPGERTAEYIDTILMRLTTVGALYLTFVCLMPEFLIAKYPIPFYLGGTSILIVVVVAMDTVTQVQTRLMSSQYESLIKKTKFGK